LEHSGSLKLINGHPSQRDKSRGTQEEKEKNKK
jgi:hypothetical protein